MPYPERQIDSEVFQRDVVIENFLTELYSKGFRLGIVEDRGMFTDAVTIPGSTKAFDFAAVMPNSGHSIQTAVEMASSALSRLHGNNALSGNLGLGITHDLSGAVTYCAYISEGKLPKTHVFSSIGNEDKELAMVLNGGREYLSGDVLAPQYFILQERLSDQELDIQNFVEEVTQYAKSQKWSITTSESCTGGFLAKQFARNRAKVFIGGVTLYNEQQKIKEGISAEQLSHGNVYSQEVALAMARAGYRNHGASISIATTGVMENPDTRPFHEHVAPGTVYYAFIICGKPFHGLIKIPLANQNGILKTRNDFKIEASGFILKHLMQCMVESVALFTKYTSQDL